MTIMQLANAQVAWDRDGVLGRKVGDGAGTQLVHLTLDPGARLAPHETPMDVFFHVIAGSGTIEVGEQGFRVRRGDTLFCPRKVLHGVENTGESPLEVLVVKTPTSP